MYCFLVLLQESQQHLPQGYSAGNVLITHWVPQTAVLGHPAVKGFLCHGGHTTTNEALATGTPMLCMPFGGDQLVVAQHIKDHGYGLQVCVDVLSRMPSCARPGRCCPQQKPVVATT
jgi:UDP:flavonoid glycosyltransferase YjiC (YdhE family)